MVPITVSPESAPSPFAARAAGPLIDEAMGSELVPLLNSRGFSTAAARPLPDAPWYLIRYWTPYSVLFVTFSSPMTTAR